MSRRILTMLLLGAALILLSCSSRNASTGWVPDVDIVPISIGESGTEPLTFKGVIYRIPVGRVLGEVRQRRRVVDEIRWTIPRTHSTEWNVAVTDGLRSYGYSVRDAADAIFDRKGRREVKVRYEMAAILHDAKLDLDFDYDARRETRGRGVGTAEVEVEVRLFDAIENRTVYEAFFSGRAREVGRKPNPMTSAVVNAILKAAGDPDFASILARSETAPSSIALDADATPIAACPRREASVLPEDLPSTLRAVVEIQVGSLGGTGVIVSPDGWVLTAAHVIAEAPEVWVRLDAGALLPAEVHSLDPRSDLALARIPGREYPCIPLRAAAEKLELGSDVFAVNIAIGDNREPTITRGVVSGFPEQEGRRFIQTDASLNPGSSGGPLLSPDGSIAGITVAKLVGNAIEGTGLAVPIDDVVRSLSIRIEEP